MHIIPFNPAIVLIKVKDFQFIHFILLFLVVMGNPIDLKIRSLFHF